jgi:DNA-binding HxlR family transcriptional regulator
MTGSRTYGDQCGIARALDVVGERWALLVVRELLLGPKRFTDLRSGLPNVSPDVLSQRLRDLETAGLLTRLTLGPPAGSRVYELTERGAQLEPVILALGRWGAGQPIAPGLPDLGVDSMVLGLKTMFDAAAASFDVTIELRLDGQSFTARVADGDFDVARGDAEEPEAVLSTTPGTLATLVWRGRHVSDAVSAGDAEVSGDRRALERFLAGFAAG